MSDTPSLQELRDAFSDDSGVHANTLNGDPFLFAYSPEARERARDWLDANVYAWHHPQGDSGVPERAVSVDGDPRVFELGGDGGE